MATLAETLAEAKAAYHQLMTGKAVRVFVDQNGERVEYQTASLTRLAAYIAWLETQLTPGLPKGPLSVWM